MAPAKSSVRVARKTSIRRVNALIYAEFCATCFMVRVGILVLDIECWVLDGVWFSRRTAVR